MRSLPEIVERDREANLALRTLKAADALCLLSEQIAAIAGTDRSMRDAARRLVGLSSSILEDARKLRRETAANFMLKAAEAAEALGGIAARIADAATRNVDLSNAASDLREISDALLRDADALRQEKERRS